MKYGVIELYDEDGNEFIVNKQRVKPYQKDVLDADKDDDITLEDKGKVTCIRMVFVAFSGTLLPVCYEDDDDEERSDSLDDNIISGLLPFSAITPNEPVLSIEEPDNSLSMGDEHLDTITVTESDEVIKSSVEDHIPIPSESEGIKASNDNPIPFYDPIISGTPLNLTPSGESDFFLEVDVFLAVEDEFTSSQFPKLYLDPEGDMLRLEAFLNDDHSSDFKTK
nr:hypothetical protein [Tanacetum cinerariifolium]